MRDITIRLLGPFEVTIDGAPVTTFTYAKVRALLAYLAVGTQRPYPRAELATLLWPDQPEQAARASLSQALTTLRNALGDKGAERPLLLADSQHVQLDPNSRMEVDVAQFLALLEAADAHIHYSWRTCSSCADHLQPALDFYRGDFLADLSIADSDVFEEWATLQREHLRQRAFSALERLVERAQWRGAYKEALTYAQRLVALEPLFEVHQRTYMRLLALNGEQAAALSQYRQYQTLLAEELVTEPEDVTTALFDQIRRGDMAGLQPAQPPFVVPWPPTSLVNRLDELQVICARLRDLNVRAVTITGAGGIGKTRLALEAAHALRYDFEDGIYFVELAALSDATLVANTIAQALGVKERPGYSIRALLCDYLRAKRLLLILDNFEHVVTAAPLVSELLAACPALTVLATSRAALTIRAEQQFTLEPLADADAMQLFLQRARAAGAVLTDNQADTAIYSEICQRLDRLPLAIELIAVRARTLTPLELLRQLERPLQALVRGPRDVPIRHRALRNAIQWSYDLLEPEEQRVFISLGVFAGGCTVEAAQAVVGDPFLVLPMLESLHGASLVQQQTIADETRFVMLETIREFAIEQLKSQEECPPAAGHLSVQRRHAEFFLALLEQAVPELSGPRRMQWTQRLKAEIVNLRIALQTLIEGRDGTTALQLVAMLWPYWSDQGYLNEGRDCLDRVLALADTTSDAAMSVAHHEALLGAAFMAFVQDDYACARQRYEELLALAQRSGQQLYTAKALNGLGIVVQCIGHLSEAGNLLEQSITASQAVGDLGGEHWTVFNLAFVRAQQGKIDAARALFERAITFNRSGANASRLGNVLAYYAYAITHQGDYGDARPLAEEALTIGIREDLPWMQQIALQTLGLLAFQHEDHATARQLFERALVQSQRLGDGLYIATALGFLGLIDIRERACVRAYERLAAALQLAQAIRSPKAITLVFEGLAYLWAIRGEWERATQLFGAIEMIYLGRGAVPAPLNYELQMPYVRAARINLGRQVFAQAWARGQELTLEAACALATAQTALHSTAWTEERALALGLSIELAPTAVVSSQL
ncbi:MAG TPA: BTAD domain-containing putative transcriptional regulator [Roseiflexaceae bacterium]|nr:BTAD domain-containing putative transcriptional regulator [Roseiflexaceae bacterium]